MKKKQKTSHGMKKKQKTSHGMKKKQKHSHGLTRNYTEKTEAETRKESQEEA
jgi:hypothetical protein